MTPPNHHDKTQAMTAVGKRWQGLERGLSGEEYLFLQRNNRMMAQPSVTPVPGDVMPSSGLASGMHVGHRQNTHVIKK